MTAFEPWPGRPWPRPGCRSRGKPTPGATRASFFNPWGRAPPKITGPWRPASRPWKRPTNSREIASFIWPPPGRLRPAITGLGQAKLNRSPGWTRLVVEKPFGRDPESAQNLNQLLHRYFDEPQIYRIDHYLGKETVQNLLIFRFANDIFEPLWHRNLVQSVQITVAESAGVGSRGNYYEQTGALRDMAQNHLTQLLTLTAMEVPVAFEPEAIRSEKAKVLRAVSPVRPEDVVYGQYTRGSVGGKEAPGYREERGVAPDSVTETFVALKLGIENWRWNGVPFYLITGKGLPARFTQIAVTFRCPPVWLFQPRPATCNPNVLVFTLQPDEGFDLHFQVKAPGEPLELKTQRLRYRYAEAFGPLPDAYETLLVDVMAGDQTLFVRADEAEAAWRIYAPLLAERPATLLLSRRHLRPPGGGPPHGMAGPGFALPLISDRPQKTCRIVKCPDCKRRTIAPAEAMSCEE